MISLEFYRLDILIFDALFLPDEWVGGYPLRKDWKQPQDQESEE